jgi:hypothetical protein
MKYAVEIGSGTVTYIPSFIKTGSGIQKLLERRYAHTDTRIDDLISLFLFLQNIESRL